MANDEARRQWRDPDFVQALQGQGAAIWRHRQFLSRPCQMAMNILEAMAEIGSFATYQEIAAAAGVGHPMTVSQCINALAAGGYPFAWDAMHSVRLAGTGRIPTGAAKAESPAKRAIALLTPFSEVPDHYDAKWKGDLYHAVREAIEILAKG